MKYIRLHTTDPYRNLAIEEYLFLHCDGDLLMLWQNEPSVVVGVNQNIRAEVDIPALSRRGVHPVRRITGGGAVYHDLGNLNYTFISSRGEGGIDFAAFCQPIIEALGSLGVTLTLSGRNDLCLPDGRKVSGNAQCARGARVLHHGTLLFDTDLAALDELLTPDEEKLRTKAVRSARARVANLKELLPGVKSVDGLADLIEKYILESMSAEACDAPVSHVIEELWHKNRSDAWLYPERGISSSLYVTRKRRFPSGTVEAELSISGERISAVRLGGDFFGTEPKETLEALISGHTISDLSELLTDEITDRCISGVSASELIELLS